MIVKHQYIGECIPDANIREHINFLRVNSAATRVRCAGKTHYDIIETYIFPDTFSV
jgi:hypothetical protein